MVVLPFPTVCGELGGGIAYGDSIWWWLAIQLSCSKSICALYKQIDNLQTKNLILALLLQKLDVFLVEAHNHNLKYLGLSFLELLIDLDVRSVFKYSSVVLECLEDVADVSVKEKVGDSWSWNQL